MPTRNTRFALAAVAVIAGGALVAGSGGLFAQHKGSHHGGKGSHHGGSAPATDASPSTKAYIAANDRMHADMAIEFTGDADIDFVKGMIPHHQGAIDMAKIVLEHGKDPEIRKLADEIIKAQVAEIAMMNAWLKQKGAK